MPGSINGVLLEDSGSVSNWLMLSGTPPQKLYSTQDRDIREMSQTTKFLTRLKVCNGLRGREKIRALLCLAGHGQTWHL